MSGLDLYLSQRELALLLVYGALVGFGLGAVYDCLRILRLLLGESTEREGRRPLPMALLLFLEDVVFMIVASLAFILLCYYRNDGQIRGPALMGLGGGFFVYRHTVSRPFLWLVRWGILGAKRMLAALLRLLAKPLRWLWAVTAGRWLDRLRERLREQATEKRIRELTEQAACGFDLLEKTGKPPCEPE